MNTDSQRHEESIAEAFRQDPSVLPATVKACIEAALLRTSIAEPGTITVAVHGSDVTLSGEVRSWEERDIATHSAWGTPGVRNIVDLLTLKPGPWGSGRQGSSI